MLTNLKRFFLAYIALIVIFLSALILSSTIPSSFLSKNIGKSLEVFKEEGTYPSYGLVPWRKIVLDNYTEPLMFNIAFSIDSTQPVRSALTNMRNAESFEQLNQIVNLDKAYYQKAKQPIGYERYWH